jgi:deoxycytidylate deaminase
MYPKWRLAAVIVRGGSVQSVGLSKLRTNPAVCDFDVPGVKGKVSTHAEIDALNRCGNPKGAVIYVARVGRSDSIALAKPCKSCQRALIEAGIKRVVYTINGIEYGVWPPED